MIRPATPADTPTLLELTAGTGVFKPSEVEVLREVLDYYHAENEAEGHVCRVWQPTAGPVLGYVYYAPEEMTDRTWYLWWIAVRKSDQAAGLGSLLLRHAENDLRSRNARVVFIETSSLPHYEPTRRFYLKHGYAVDGQLRDFYSDGDDMVVFRKYLGTSVGQ